MRAVVVVLACTLLMAVPLGTGQAPSPAATLEPVPPPLYPVGSNVHSQNVAAWVSYYVESTGDDEVPPEVMETIAFVAQYSAPMSGGPLIPPNATPIGVHAGYMYLECDFGGHGNCFWDDWWGNSGVFCGRSSYSWPIEYTQVHSKFTMGEWGNGFVKTLTEYEVGLHFSSLVDGAILGGYICVAQIGLSIVGIFSGTGIFDQDFLVDPLPPPWQVVPVEVPRPPPPYDNLGPPVCGHNEKLPPGNFWLCWGPEDLMPQMPR